MFELILKKSSCPIYIHFGVVVFVVVVIVVVVVVKIG